MCPIQLLYQVYGKSKGERLDYLVIIQARCGSLRMPNKVLVDLSGKPALQRMIERVQQSKIIQSKYIFVATSIEQNNFPILELCAKNKIRVFVGSEEDVLDRFYQLARLFKPKYVIRLTADCPLFDAKLLDDGIQCMLPSTDLLTMRSSTFPDGLDFEIMKWEALELAWKNAKLPSEREHVTQFFTNHPDQFSIQDYFCSEQNLGAYRWTIDEPEDYEVVKAIYQYFISQSWFDFDYLDILSYVENNPELSKINAKFTRNEGLFRSLARDNELD